MQNSYLKIFGGIACHFVDCCLAYSWVYVLCLLISATVVAQEEPTPKVDLFVGYQWLHPGIRVPFPFPASQLLR